MPFFIFRNGLRFSQVSASLDIVPFSRLWGMRLDGRVVGEIFHFYHGSQNAFSSECVSLLVLVLLASLRRQKIERFCLSPSGIFSRSYVLFWQG